MSSPSVGQSSRVTRHRRIMLKLGPHPDLPRLSLTFPGSSRLILAPAPSGVSILLTMLVLQQKRDLGLGGSKVVCYAFAPPPVFGPLHKLSSEAHDAIHVFAFGNDMVTRMSVGNAFELFRDLKEVDSLGVSHAGSR